MEAMVRELTARNIPIAVPVGAKLVGEEINVLKEKNTSFFGLVYITHDGSPDG